MLTHILDPQSTGETPWHHLLQGTASSNDLPAEGQQKIQTVIPTCEIHHTYIPK
jgi:hypothetical protein